MIITVSHSTHYSYENQVRASIQYLRLTPATTARQQVLNWHLSLPARAQQHLDAFGNSFHVLAYDVPHKALDIVASGQVRLDGRVDSEPLEGSALPYLRVTSRTASNSELAELTDLALRGEVSREALIRLMGSIHSAMPYRRGATTVDTTATEAYARRQGVCQDHTHVFLACCRHAGIPARYVSGYLQTSQSEHIASHAWAEACVDGRWYTFDVANNLVRPDRHVRLAVGMDYLDCCPVRGVRQGGGGETMQAQVRVEMALQQQ